MESSTLFQRPLRHERIPISAVLAELRREPNCWHLVDQVGLEQASRILASTVHVSLRELADALSRSDLDPWSAVTPVVEGVELSTDPA